MTDVDYEKLVNSILSIMMKRGILSTTMDQLASTLRISKRTLYEIFISKDLLVEEVLKAYMVYVRDNQRSIVDKSENIIDALIKIFIFSRSLLAEINLDFYRDMDNHLHLQKDFEETELLYNAHMLEIIKDGIRKGLVRDDIDFLLMYRLMLIQMNLLKQMDNPFPQDISILDVYNTIFLGFLRSIVSHKGMSILDGYLPEYPELNKKLAVV